MDIKNRSSIRSSLLTLGLSDGCRQNLLKKKLKNHSPKIFSLIRSEIKVVESAKLKIENVTKSKKLEKQKNLVFKSAILSFLKFFISEWSPLVHSFDSISVVTLQSVPSR